MLTFGSIFSGIEGFGLGFENAGMECVWQIEKDDQCAQVLEKHWPNLLRLRDVKDAGQKNLPAPDVICGGWPCQGLSVAGLRKGLADHRSNLFFEFIRIINELAEKRRRQRLPPLLVVWENVPGLRTSCSCRECGRRCRKCETLAGADEETCFVCGSDKLRGRVLREHRGADFFTVVSTFGLIGFDGAWTLLDAQWFGLAQRRQRLFGVFAQRGFGAARCAEILSFQTRLQGDSEESSKEGKAVAATITGGSGKRGHRPGRRQEDDFNLVLFGGNNTSGSIDVAPAMRPHNHQDFESEALVVSRPLARRKGNSSHCEDKETFVVAHTLTGRHDGSEDGSNHGTPLVVGPLTAHATEHGHAMTTQQAAESNQLIPFNVHSQNSGAMSGDGVAEAAIPTDVARALDSNGGHTASQGGTVVAYQNHGTNVGEMGTLRTQTDAVPFVFEARVARNGRGKPEEIAPPIKARSGRTGKGDGAPLVFDPRQVTSPDNHSNPQAGDPCHTIPSDGRSPAAVAYSTVTAFANGQGDPNADDSDLAYALDAGRGIQGIQYESGVRRLTPIECCRLQGFPDDWFEGTGLSDSAMYRCLGNAVARNCAEWIGTRLVTVVGERDA